MILVSQRSQTDGVCDFPCDPEAFSSPKDPIWTPNAQPRTVCLAAEPRGAAPQTFDLTKLADLDLREADDGWHGAWHVDGVTHRFWSADAIIPLNVPLTVELPMDDFFELRTNAARRFWRSLNSRSPGPDFRTMPAQTRRFHLQALRVLDARQSGESYRAIAEALFGFLGTKEDWEIDPRKNKVRRLVAHGVKMMKGGYRKLLCYPITPRR